MIIKEILTFASIALLFMAIASTRAGLYENAIVLWKDAAGKSPSKARTRNNLGRGYAEKKMSEHALKEFREAVRQDPLYPPPHSNLANIYIKTGQIDDAERELNLAIALFAKRRLSFEDLHRMLGIVYLRKGLIEDAQQEFKRALSLIPDYPEPLRKIASLYTNEGWSYNDRGDFLRALLLHAVAASADPSYADSRYGLALAYTALGKREEAIQHWQEYLKLAPPDEPFRKDAMEHLNRLR